MTFHKSSRYLDIQLQLQRRDKGRVNVGTLRTLLLLHPGPAVENEEKIVLGWNMEQCPVCSGWGSTALTKLSSCCHLALVRGFNSYFQLAEAEPEQLQYMFIICSYTRVRAW